MRVPLLTFIVWVISDSSFNFPSQGIKLRDFFVLKRPSRKGLLIDSHNASLGMDHLHELDRHTLEDKTCVVIGDFKELSYVKKRGLSCSEQRSNSLNSHALDLNLAHEKTVISVTLLLSQDCSDLNGRT